MNGSYDFIIIGTGAGGGTLLHALRESGARLLVLERGDFLPKEDENWQVKAVFDQKRYKPKEQWINAADGSEFQPGVHYFVGGNTKVYGAALPRLRREDFAALEHEGGTSPAWCIRYEDLEPYYNRAEAIYAVHGQAGIDPTEPPRSQPYPYPAVPHEPTIADLMEALQKQHLHPFFLPMGIDLRDGGRCIRCKTCDGFPCKLDAKSDADVRCVRPALAGGADVTLWTNTLVRRLIADPGGRRLSGVEIERDGQVQQVRADLVIVCCGAVNSAALLLRSADSRHPDGLANASGMVGRNYMVHNNTALTAVSPLKRNPTVFQKTMAVNDFYLRGPDFAYPMGNLQMLGKLQAGMLSISQPLVPEFILQGMAGRSVDWWVMSEDLPDPENRITLRSDGRIVVHWKPNNRAAHARLITAARAMMRAAGYPFVFTQTMGIETNSHQCGTLRFGDDPAQSVLDPFCKAHDLDNLYVVDSSFFPSSAAMNPALTIAAQALRVADHLMGKRSV
ncbi:MAG: GMC family oxidoreductase [Anaerolineae bacterium]|nr:GMC family oxidoreductase [Anaerolineae bacterium]NUQ05349.1 GMC family oxidoreductase [Anaerolineae bacterium]